jgi:hypothetical protein
MEEEFDTYGPHIETHGNTKKFKIVISELPKREEAEKLLREFIEKQNKEKKSE